MRITPEVLVFLGATRMSDGSWRLEGHDVSFFFSDDDEHRVGINGDPVWNFDGRGVASLEDVIFAAYFIGRRDGAEELRQEFQRFIEEKVSFAEEVYKEFL